MTHAPEQAFVRAPARRTPLAGNALGMAAMVMWAAGFPAAEILLDDWPVLALIAARLLMAMAFLIPLWMLIEGPRVMLTANWGRGTIVGGIGFGLGTWFILAAQALTDPVTVAIIATSMPIAAAMIEIIRGDRRLTPRFATGLALSVLGGLVAVGQVQVADLGLGAALAVTSAFLFAWGSDAAVRDLPDLTPLGRTTVTFGGALILIAVIFVGAHTLGMAAVPVQVTVDHLGLLAIYAVAAMALSQVLWIAAVGRLGVAVASFHINTAVFYTMLIMLAFGATWNWFQALGAGIVVIGVLVASAPERRRPMFRTSRPRV